MTIASLLPRVLLVASILSPSLAGAAEIEFLCKGNAWSTGEGRLTVDPAANRAFGRHDEINAEGWGARVRISGDIYLAELFDNQGRVFHSERLDTASGTYTLVDKTAGDTNSWSAKCAPIGTPPPN